MDPRIESILQHLTEDFPALMTPEFIGMIEKSIENKAFHDQMSYLKDEILPALQEGESGIMGVENSLDNDVYDESFEKDFNGIISINTVEQDIKEELNEDNLIEEPQGKIEELDNNHDQEDKDPIEKEQEQLLLYNEELFNYLKEKLEVISTVEELNELMPEVKRAENEKITRDSKALLHRKVGELYLKHDCKEETLNSFQKALEYNQKVGVKRLYNKLKKEIS